MHKNLKSTLISLGLGTLVTLLTGTFLLTISLDMRWMTTVAFVLAFLASSMVARRWKISPWLFLPLFHLPFVVFIYLVIFPDLPSLWIIIPGMLLVTLAGLLWAGSETRKRRLMGLIAAVFPLAIVVWLIPGLVGNDLMKETRQTAGSFSFIDLEENVIDSSELAGKVVVIDFFGTWCRPCIAELPELAKVREHFSGNEQVRFFVVNSDEAGDTLEKARRFATRYNYGFRYGYDYDRKAYKTLGLSGAGVPSLVVLDKEGNVRLKHIGFNQAETDFARQIIDLLERILSEG